MLYKIVIALLILVLLNLFLKSCSDLLTSGADVVSAKKMWVRVVSVEEKIKEISNKYTGKYKTKIWNVTVRINEQHPIVYMPVGPPPKSGSCLPIIANFLSNGHILAFLDEKEWRYGVHYGDC